MKCLDMKTNKTIINYTIDNIKKNIMVKIKQTIPNVNNSLGCNDFRGQKFNRSKILKTLL